MVRALLSLKELPQPADAADALAVALCHIQTARSEARFGVSARLLAAPRASRGNSIRGNSVRGNPVRLPRVLSV
jgi:hypothetical protein